MRVECLPNEMPIGTCKYDAYSNANECHFLISTTRIVRIDKMIVMYLRTFIIKILFFIFIKPPLYKRFGRHSTTDISYCNYTKQMYIIQ